MADTTNTVGIKVVADTSGVTAEMRKIDQAAARTAGELEKVGKSGGFKKAGEDASGASAKIEASQRNLIGSIQRTTAAMESGGRSTAKYYELLAQQRGVDGNALAPYLAQLRAVEAAQAKSNAALGGGAPALDKIGVSAKQTAAALRGVPAQFTDIITSIQGGQAPLTVLLQQGGQLKDTFGGAGNAARALGGYVVGLINPFTLAAAAVAGLAVAYNQGSKEADAYNRALILTGNAAGVTSGQLADMAARISDAAGTQGQAAAAVAAIADTGRVSANNIERFSKVAADAQRVLGTAVADTAKEFADLGKNPVAALEKLNERYRFLTPAVYEQVKALEDQGRAEDAAAAAQSAYAAAMESRTKGVKDNLGTLETAWKNVGNFASAAWDKMLGIGRADTLTEKLAKVQAEIAKAQKPFDPAFGGNAEARAKLAENIELELSLQNQIKLGKEKAAADAAAARIAEANVAWSKEGDKYLSRAAQQQREITKARNEGAAAGKSQAEIEERVAAIREKYKDGSIAAAVKKEASAYANLTTSIKERIAAAANEAAGNAPLTESQKLQVALTEQLRSGKLKLSAAHKAEYESLIGTLAAYESSVSTKKLSAKLDIELAKITKERADATAKLLGAAEDEAKKNEELARTYGMTKGAIEALELARLEEQLAQRSSLGLTLDEIDTLEKLIDAKKRSAAAMSSVDAQEAVKVANKAMADDWKRTVETYEDVFRTGFADMLNKGKDGWKSFTKSLVTTFKTSVADQIYKMFAQPFVVKMVASLIGVTGGSGIPGIASASGGGGDYISLAQSAKATYDAITNGFDNVSQTVANVTQRGINAATGANPQYGPMADGMATNGTFANATGQFASIAAGYMAGSALNKAISGGYETGSGVMKVEKVATAIASYINPALGAVVGAISGVINRAFGMKDKEITGTSINGSFGANGFVGSTDAAWKQKGGWFRSDKSGVDSTAIDAETAKQFSAGYDAIKVASTDFAKVLGVNADLIKNRSQSLSIALTKDEEANKKAISDFFVGVGNSIATELLPTLSDFAKEGEGASATLQRLATNYATIDAALTAIGLSFGAVGADSLAARERLVTLSGGIDALAQNAAGFAQNFLTEAERIAPVAAAVSKAMGDLGFSMVDTRDEFKALVQSLDLTTESGASNYAALMKLQGAFAQVYPVIEATTSAIEDQAAAMEAIKSSAAGLLGGVDDSFAVLQRVANAEKDRATKAHEVTMRRLQASIDLETAAVAKRRALSDAISSTLSQRGTDLDRSGAQAQIQAAIAIAKASGVLPSADSLKEALSILSRDSGDMFSTLQDQQRDAAQTQNSLAELGKLSDAALSVEERTLAALEKQKEAAQAAYDAEISRLDEVLKAAQSQIDVLKGIDTSVLSVEQAIEGLAAALLNAKSNPIIGATAGINNAYQTALGRAPDAAGMAWWQEKAASGVSTAEIVDAIAKSPEARLQSMYSSTLGRSADAGGLDFFMRQIASGTSYSAIQDALTQSDEYKKKLRGFAVGTNYLPKTMPILAHEGERIIPAADNRELMAALRNPSENSAALVQELRAVRGELAAIKREVSRGADGSVQAGDILDRTTAGGGPMITEVVNNVKTVAA